MKRATRGKNWTETELKEYARKYRAATIPVHLQIHGRQRILNLMEVEKILRSAQTIALGNCFCRKKIRKCNSPLDTCLSLNKMAEELITKGLSAKINLESALKTLKRAHKAGLVHVTYAIPGKDKPEYIL